MTIYDDPVFMTALTLTAYEQDSLDLACDLADIGIDPCLRSGDGHDSDEHFPELFW